MKNRVITASIIAIVVVTCILLGGFFFHSLIFVAMLIVGDEIMSLSQNKDSITSKLFTLFPALAYLVFVFNLSFTLILIFPLLILILFVFDPKTTLNHVLYGFFHFCFTLIVGLSILMIFRLQPLYILYVGLCTFGSDTGGFFAGKFFGKHKLAPLLSPKKTVEGAVGGWILGALSSFIFSILIVGHVSLMFVVASILLPLVSQIGDLSFSKIKRELKIKDFSNLLPGHGGLLDRIDSFTFTLIVFNVLVFL